MTRGNLSALSLAAVFVVMATSGARADGPRTGDSSAACCGRESFDISRLHKNADRYLARFKPRQAIPELEKILANDPANFAALVKLARAHIDIGDLVPEASQDSYEKRVQEYSVAEDYARKAIRVDPQSTWGHFYVAASLGNIALFSPVEKQIDLAEEIRRAVERAIALDPQNGFAYHIYGVWHRKMAEIGNTSRILASVVYGRSLPTGSVERSIEYLSRAVSLNPTVIVSRFELAKSYIAAENWLLARKHLKAVQELPVSFSDDAKHKQRAEQLLEEISNR